MEYESKTHYAVAGQPLIVGLIPDSTCLHTTLSKPILLCYVCEKIVTLIKSMIKEN